MNKLFAWWTDDPTITPNTRLTLELASALIVCHDRKRHSGSEGARRLFDAVNELFCFATTATTEVQL